MQAPGDDFSPKEIVEDSLSEPSGTIDSMDERDGFEAWLPPLSGPELSISIDSQSMPRKMLLQPRCVDKREYPGAARRLVRIFGEARRCPGSQLLVSKEKFRNWPSPGIVTGPLAALSVVFLRHFPALRTGGSSAMKPVAAAWVGNWPTEGAKCGETR